MLQDIIVTGERIDRSIFDTASSVILFDAAKLERRTDDRVDQLYAFIPNVQPGSGTEGPAIRGQDTTGPLRDVTAFMGGTRPRMTLSVDGRALSYYEFIYGVASTWDVSKVELFRSPQTTTQGRNSIAGAIIVQTSDPAFEWEGRARLIAGNYATWQGSAMVSGPIVDGQIAFRATVDARTMQTSSEMPDAVVGADTDRDDYSVARLKLLVTPKALPALRLQAVYMHAQSLAPQFDGVAPPFEDRRLPGPEITNGVFRINSDSLTTLVRIEPANGLLWNTVLTWGDGRVQRHGLPGLGQALTNAHDFSLESVVNWQAAPSLQLLGGISRLASRLDQTIDIRGLGQGLGAFDDRQESVGVFGEASWHPVPALSITTGLRFQHDRQDRKGRLRRPTFDVPLDYDRSFSAWLPKISVAYEITSSLTAGLLAQRAFNPGGTTISFYTLEADNFEAETLWSYEAFLRASFADGRGLFTANLFYTDIANAQRLSRYYLTPQILVTDVVNMPSAESLGMELEMQWRPSDRLSLQLGAGLLETRILEAARANDPMLGKQFQRSPGFSASAAVSWEPLEGLDLSAQMRTSSGYFSDDTNNPALRIDGWTLVNARAAYSWGAITAFGYVRNLFDSFYLTYLFTPILGTAGDPREFGLGLAARF